VDTDRFDRLSRAISSLLTRRNLAGVLGLGIVTLPGLTDARKKRKHKKKVKKNQFGCVDVGKFCTNGGQCCSGICQGKKGKKTCQGHDQSTCQAGQSPDICGDGANVPCTSADGLDGTCFTTTGKSAFCLTNAHCVPCQKDADCVPLCGDRGMRRLPGAVCDDRRHPLRRVKCGELHLRAVGPCASQRERPEAQLWRHQPDRKLHSSEDA
jgi:hypothetical protein